MSHMILEPTVEWKEGTIPNPKSPLKVHCLEGRGYLVSRFMGIPWVTAWLIGAINLLDRSP